MAIIAKIGIEYVQGQAARLQAVKDAVEDAKNIPTPVAVAPAKAKAKAKKEAE